MLPVRDLSAQQAQRALAGLLKATAERHRHVRLSSQTSSSGAHQQHDLAQAAAAQAKVLVSLQVAAFSLVQMQALQSPFISSWQSAKSGLQVPFRPGKEWLLPGAQRITVRGPRRCLGILPGNTYQVIQPGPWWTPSGVAEGWRCLPTFKWAALFAVFGVVLYVHMREWFQDMRRRSGDLELSAMEQFALFLRSSKAAQIDKDQWWDIHSVEESWQPSVQQHQ
ncbi:hypothetical protein WJX73_000249 [Symbiochloris irregularis]|uniref:Uncharacterized protein n=1 Tax=Symbiochloris irregularis TaxID=706552 RepID=A0AAW1PVW3_9CHLO